VLQELVEAGGTKRFNPIRDFVKVGHLRHMTTLGFATELTQKYAVTFEITEKGRRALEDPA
jgi:hypothetical protein